jgi:hypothetical protein
MIRTLKLYKFNTDVIEKYNGDNKFIAKGNGGAIYKFDNKVLKITTDISEYICCVPMIGNEYDNLPNIYAVDKMSNKYIQIYVIVMEDLLQLNTKLRKILNNNITIINDFMNSDNVELKLNNEEDKKYNLFQQIHSIKKQAMSLKPKSYDFDIHIDNFMTKKNGNLCIIDFLLPKRYV